MSDTYENLLTRQGWAVTDKLLVTLLLKNFITLYGTW
jgi:hypothetical protein